MVLPEPVDDHSPGERIRRIGDPTGQRQATTGRFPLRLNLEGVPIAEHARGFGMNLAGTCSAHDGDLRCARSDVANRQRHLGLLRHPLLKLFFVLLPVFPLREFLALEFFGKVQAFELVGDLKVSQHRDRSLLGLSLGLGFPQSRSHVRRKFLNRRFDHLRSRLAFELIELRSNRLGALEPSFELISAGFETRCIRWNIVPGLDRRKKGLEPIVVLLQQRIELMVVASGA